MSELWEVRYKIGDTEYSSSTDSLSHAKAVCRNITLSMVEGFLITSESGRVIKGYRNHNQRIDWDD